MFFRTISLRRQISFYTILLQQAASLQSYHNRQFPLTAMGFLIFPSFHKETAAGKNLSSAPPLCLLFILLRFRLPVISGRGVLSLSVVALFPVLTVISVLAI